MAKVHSSAGASKQWGGRRPRLLAALSAWAFLAGLIAIQRSGASVRSCQRASAEAQDAAAALAADAATAAQPAARPQLPALPQPAQEDRWPALRSLPQDRIEQLIRAPAQLHGPVQKGGLPANYMFTLAHLTDTDPRVREEGIPRTHGPAVNAWFAHAFTFDKGKGHSNWGLQSPIPACHFWADHRYRLLYVRNFKTAGTSITITLGQKELPMYCTHSPATCDKKCQGKQVCFENVIDPEQLRQMFKNYTVFAFTRNPWARALSSWHHVHKHALTPGCQDSFTTWAELPSRYGAKCLGIRNCCRRRFGWVLEHTEPQATCLFDDQGQPAVDFLGRVEHLDDDMQELVRLVNSRLPAGVEPLRVGALPHWQLSKEELKGREDDKWRYYASLYANSSTALQDIRSYFHADFDLLRIPMP